MENHLIRILYFILLIPISQFCLKWLWTAACRSSLKRESEVRQYEIENRNFKGQSNASGWLINTSPTPHKTLLLVTLHSLLFIPAPISHGISIMAYFVEPLISVSKVLAVVLPCVYFSSLIIGLIYLKFSKEPDYSEAGKDFPTSEKSLQLEDIADDWETGKYKSRFKYAPSNLPRLILLAVWTAVFLTGFIILLTNNGGQTAETPEAEIVKAETVKAQLEEQGLKIFDNTAYYRNNWDSLTESFTTHKDDVTMVFYFFEDASGAEECYNYYIQKYAFTAKEGTIVNENGFVSYSEIYGSSYWCVARFGNSTIEAHCSVDEAPIFEELVKEIGYLKE